jgi:hypothetical protein
LRSALFPPPEVHQQHQIFLRSSLWSVSSVPPAPRFIVAPNLLTKLFAISLRRNPYPPPRLCAVSPLPAPGSTPATPNLPPKLFVVRLMCTLRSKFYRSSKPSYEALCDQPTVTPQNRPKDDHVCLTSRTRSCTCQAGATVR